MARLHASSLIVLLLMVSVNNNQMSGENKNCNLRISLAKIGLFFLLQVTFHHELQIVSFPKIKTTFG